MKRFHYVIACSEIKGMISIIFRTAGRQHNNRHFVFFSYLPADLHTIKIWEHDIKQNRIWLYIFDEFKCLLTIISAFYSKSFLLKMELQYICNWLLVIYYNDLFVHNIYSSNLFFLPIRQSIR